MIALLLLAASQFAETVPQPRVAAICVSTLAGAFDCFDTMFASQEWRDCTDKPEIPIGYGDRGGGVIEWGNTVMGRWEPDGRAVYEYAGVQAQAGGVRFAVVGVDGDRIFGDGMDRLCREGRFVP